MFNTYFVCNLLRDLKSYIFLVLNACVNIEENRISLKTNLNKTKLISQISEVSREITKFFTY